MIFPSFLDCLAFYLFGCAQKKIAVKIFGVQGMIEFWKWNLKAEFLKEESYFHEKNLVFKHLENKEIQSKTVIVANCKKESNIYLNTLKDKGYIIGKGYGSAKNQIRIANFPTYSKEVFELLCDELTYA